MAGIFVFGSNLAGRHGKGAALEAKMRFGAQYGVGEGRTGNSYAIPTKDENLDVRSLSDIQRSVNTFLAYARAHPELEFFVTRIGCGLAGFRDNDIGPMFATASDNVKFITDEGKPDWEDYRQALRSKRFTVHKVDETDKKFIVQKEVPFEKLPIVTFDALKGAKELVITEGDKVFMSWKKDGGWDQ